MYGIDQYYIILVLPALILSIFAQFKVKSTFNKYSRVRNTSGMTGADVARLILDRNGLSDVRIERVAGELTDHYDPRTRVIRLSQSVYGSNSVAAIGVAAHETGHAIQHSEQYGPWFKTQFGSGGKHRFMFGIPIGDSRIVFWFAFFG